MPLIAIYDPVTRDQIFFQDQTPNQHFRKYWTFSDEGFVLKDPKENGIPEFTPMESHEHLLEALYKA